MTYREDPSDRRAFLAQLREARTNPEVLEQLEADTVEPTAVALVAQIEPADEVMTLGELLDALDRAGARLRFTDGELRIEPDSVTRNPAIGAAVALHRQQLIAEAAGRTSGHRTGFCDQCGQPALIGVAQRGGTPCRLTPGCNGRHQHRGTQPPSTPLHRVDDMPTARQAGRAQTPQRLGAGRQKVLAALAELGTATDHTVAEYAEMPTGSAAKRRLELQRAGLVEEAGRSTSPNGSPATLWRLTDQGRRTAGRSGDAA